MPKGSENMQQPVRLQTPFTGDLQRLSNDLDHKCCMTNAHMTTRLQVRHKDAACESTTISVHTSANHAAAVTCSHNRLFINLNMYKASHTLSEMPQFGCHCDDIHCLHCGFNVAQHERQVIVVSLQAVQYAQHLVEI